MITVQQLANDGLEPPWRYINKGRPIDASSSSSIPIIDLGLLKSSSIQEKEDEMEKLRCSLASWGLFQAIGHGISSTLLDEMYGAGKDFFNLPMEKKRKYSRVGDDGKTEGLEGYGEDNQVKSEETILDWCDRLYLLVKPEHQRKLKLWPEDPKHFRETLHEYSIKASVVANDILRALAESVGLEKNCFLAQFGECAPMYARMNYYPPCSRPDHVDGIRPHTDGGGITIVLPDKQVAGLQVLKDGKWIKVPIVPHALVVNIADQMENLTKNLWMLLLEDNEQWNVQESNTQGGNKFRKGKAFFGFVLFARI